MTKNRNFAAFLLSIFLLLAIASFCFADEQNEPSWVYKGRGDRYLLEGQIGAAITQYKKAIIAKRQEAGTDKTGTYPEVQYKLAEIYMDERLNEIALQHINSAENEREFLQIPDFIYDILYLKAVILFNMKHYANTMAVYERIIQDDENWEYYSKEKLTVIPDTLISEIMDNPKLRSTYGKAYYRIGEIKYQNNNFVTAEPYLKMAFLYGYGENAKKYLVACYKKLGMDAQIKRLQTLK